MPYWKFIPMLLLPFVLVACGNNSDLSINHKGDETTIIENVSHDKIGNQEPANKAKEILIKHEEVMNVKAVNSKDEMIIAVEIEHHERFNLANLRKKYTKEIKDKFKELEVELSTDKKISLELEKLEQKIKEEHVSDKKLKKEINRIIKLSKEQT